MITEPLTRRSVVIGGLLATTTLSGCSAAELTTRKVVDPQAADRARIARAIALSTQVRSLIDHSPAGSPRVAAAFRTFAALHETQIAAFARSAGMAAPATPAAPLPGAGPLSLGSLRRREQEHARALRDLALSAASGQVAALLASAAAGIDQAWAG